MDEQSWLNAMRGAESALYRVTCAMLPQEHDRRDAMQETALRAWEKRGTLRETAYFQTWAVRICVNVCRDMKRRARVTAPVETVPDAPSPARDNDFRLLLDALPEALRLPLVLHYLEGMDIREVARALRIPEGTVKYRLHQARKRLRVELDEEEA